VATLYEDCGGFDQILVLTQRWHQLVLQHPEAAHPFEHDIHPHHDIRLAAYLAEAFGGPALYSAGYGDESYVQKIHSGNGVHVSLDEACIDLFDQALKDVGITSEAGARASAYFRKATEDQRTWGDPSAEVPIGLPMNYSS